MAERLRRVLGWLWSHPGLKLASFGLALTTWLWVQQSQVHTDRLRVPLDVQLADDVVFVDPIPSRAIVTVEGPRSVVRRAQQDADLSLHVDLRELGPGVHEVPLAAYPVEDLPNQLSVTATTPNSVRLRLDERVRGMLTVEVRHVGTLGPGQRLERVTASPSTVEVEGPRMVLSQLEFAPTAAVDLALVGGDLQVPVQLDLPRSVQPVQPWAGVAELQVEALDSVVTFAEVPVMVWDNPGYAPAAAGASVRLELSGPSDVLRSLRLDEVLVVVRLPENADAERYTATYGAERGARLDVLHPRPDVVRVINEPAAVEVLRR